MFSLKLLTATLLLGATTLAQAGFTILGTRVIYHEADHEATVHLQRTHGTAPVLLQAWLDDGAPDARPGAQDLPFVLTPAVSRVDADGAQVVRILYTGETLPADRETLFFFNALEVPSVFAPGAQAPHAGDRKNTLQFAMQARLKFFYRPKKLAMTPAQAFDLIDFSLVKAVSATTEATPEAASGVARQLPPLHLPPLQLRIHNPTPYYITVPKLALHEDSTADNVSDTLSATRAVATLRDTAVAPMVAPYSDLVVPLELAVHHLHATALAKHLTVHYSVINDQGGLNAKIAGLSDAV